MGWTQTDQQQQQQSSMVTMRAPTHHADKTRRALSVPTFLWRLSLSVPSRDESALSSPFRPYVWFYSRPTLPSSKQLPEHVDRMVHTKSLDASQSQYFLRFGCPSAGGPVSHLNLSSLALHVPSPFVAKCFSGSVWFSLQSSISLS